MTSISEPIKFGEAGAALRELRKAIIGEPISDFNDFDLFMQVNLELPVTQKFQSFNEFTRGLRAASEDPTYGARMCSVY